MTYIIIIIISITNIIIIANIIIINIIIVSIIYCKCNTLESPAFPRLPGASSHVSAEVAKEFLDAQNDSLFPWEAKGHHGVLRPELQNSLYT